MISNRKKYAYCTCDNQIENLFLTADSTQKLIGYISVNQIDIIHHYPGAHVYDVPGSARTFTTYPSRHARLRLTRVGTHVYDLPDSSRTFTTFNYHIASLLCNVKLCSKKSGINEPY